MATQSDWDKHEKNHINHRSLAHVRPQPVDINERIPECVVVGSFVSKLDDGIYGGIVTYEYQVTDNKTKAVVYVYDSTPSAMFKVLPEQYQTDQFTIRASFGVL